MIVALILGAALQTAHGPPTPTAPTPAAQSLDDRVAALVGQGKCADAKAAATDGGDANLASQVDELCGVHPTNGGGGKGGGRGRGGGGGGGRGGGSHTSGG